MGDFHSGDGSGAGHGRVRVDGTNRFGPGFRVRHERRQQLGVEFGGRATAVDGGVRLGTRDGLDTGFGERL
ncbi:hypothetical protein [Catenulispora pinisilvae]|uniref:hypothetical protein n=1 Tax=Catenulispora pinisilvae TaxID=2705253 RepID=UPI001890E0B5|nr:hypothetical protein [Catenulispora pinisilvae]